MAAAPQFYDAAAAAAAASRATFFRVENNLAARCVNAACPSSLDGSFTLAVGDGAFCC